MNAETKVSEGSHVYVLQVVFRWGQGADGCVLATKGLKTQGRISVGSSGCDFYLPPELLGADAIEMATWDGEKAIVSRPNGAQLVKSGLPANVDEIELRVGETADVLLGAFSMSISIDTVARTPKGSPLECMKRNGALGLASSALVHTALFASVGLFAPALTETDAEALERDRVFAMRQYLDAAAARETEPIDSPPIAANDAQSAALPGHPAQGAGGAMGSPRNKGSGAWSAAGHARPEEASLSRVQELALARDFGIISMISALSASDPNAPVVPWGRALDGSDKENHFGNLWAPNIGDALGLGLGLSGTGEGGDGFDTSIGLRDIGGLNDSLGRRLGDPGGVGGCAPGAPCGPHLGRRHQAAAFTMRMPVNIETNGRLPADVIQRIVRQNQGRFRACYETGLVQNPGLQGRVAVRFVIDRSGSVALANDSGSDLPDLQVRTCVVKGFYSLSFPEAQGGNVTVTYPILFTPTG